MQGIAFPPSVNFSSAHRCEMPSVECFIKVDQSFRLGACRRMQEHMSMTRTLPSQRKRQVQEFGCS
jgi:hypothetical protein